MRWISHNKNNQGRPNESCILDAVGTSLHRIDSSCIRQRHIVVHLRSSLFLLLPTLGDALRTLDSYHTNVGISSLRRRHFQLLVTHLNRLLFAKPLERSCYANLMVPWNLGGQQQAGVAYNALCSYTQTNVYSN